MERSVMKPTRLFSDVRKRLSRAVCVLLLLSFLLTELSPLAILLSLIPQAEAAEVTVTNAENTTAVRHIHGSPLTVFVSDDVGYRFFVDSAIECSYVKTTDGGASWGGQQKVDDQGAATDCVNISVWYDRWTPGDTGDYIHIVTMDTGSDDLFYNRLDTTDDSLLAGSTAVLFSTAAGYPTVTIDAGANYPSIAKSTDGVLYVSIDEATVNGSWVFRCSTTCGTASNWTEAGTSPQDDVNDWSTLVPLLNGNMMLINRDISADDIRSRVWSATSSSWSAGWVIVDGAAIENGTYDIQMSAVTSEDGDVYLAYMTDTTTLGTNDDLQTARYSTTWSSSTADIVTNSSRGLTQVAIGLDANTDDVYVAYSARLTANQGDTANVYWHLSTDNMSSWGVEQGPINASNGNLYGIDINNYSNERVYVSWADMTGGTIQGDTLADVYGGILVSATGTQTSVVRASTTNFYTGGAFVFAENISAREISSITISENGSVDGATGIDNIKLLYEHDTTAPYNCESVSYGGSESQYGVTDTTGFSAADGVSAFNDTSIVASTTASLCVYVVVDVTSQAADTSSLNLSINDPSTDVTVSGGGSVVPESTVEMNASTTIRDSVLTQTHYHFRNDNGSETTATSRTLGVEDTPVNTLQKGVTTRLRFGISNEGSTSSLPTAFRIEYSEATSTCDLATGWTDVGATDDAFNMSNSVNLSDGADTTDVAVANGGVTDENVTFLTPNGGVRDTSSVTGSITFATSSYTALEYSVVASSSAIEGNTYCFRVTDGGTPLPDYDNYPLASIASDVRMSATGTQATSISIPSTNQHIGGSFVITENSSSRDITDISIREQGTVDAQNGINNIRLVYDVDTSAPYNCASESYSGSEPQFGVTDTDGFTSADGSASFNDAGVSVSTTSTLCFYVVLDVTEEAQNGETLDVYVLAPSTDVLVSGGGTVSPSTPVDISGLSTLAGAILTQTHYHFRNDDGSEAGATSATGGTYDTALADVAQGDAFRLRMQVSNEGSTSSVPTRLQLEYGTKITTCSNIGVWNVVDSVNAAFAMVDTVNLTQGNNTTNIAEAIGGMPDENTTFKAANAAVNDTSAISATTTLSSTEFIEAEFSVLLTTNAGYDTDYCFRLTNAGTEINSYSNYAELASAPKRDFKVQRGSSVVATTTVTIRAGTDYEAPASSSRAFIRITNSHNTGAGRTAAGGNQNADDLSVYITNPQNLLTSVTFARFGAANNSRVDWEIVEYIGEAGGDNEIIVRQQGEVRYGTTDTSTSTPSISGIIDDADVVVFITGAFSPDTALSDYEALQSTASWASSTDVATFTRGVSGSDAVRLSYAVVEFVGVNWEVQRVEYTYSDTAGNIETVNIDPVNSLSRAFIHTQKRMTNGLQSMADFGHEVWLSSIGVLSLRLDSLASTPSGHTSVVWIVENTQLTLGAMEVHRINGSTSAGTEPLALSVDIGATLADMANSSISGNTRLSQTGTNFPRPIAGLSVASTTAIQLWRSDTGNTLTYRIEVIEWPVAELAFRQNYYEFYADNGSTTPTDAWPPGGTAIGENAAITVTDSPVAEGEHLRIRMSLRVQNATFPDNNQSFKLEYGRRVTTCSAIASWNDVGAIGSGSIWRGYDNATPADGATLPSTLLSVSDEAGTYEEENNSSVNPTVVIVGEDIEYDWVIQHNGAVQRADYCFRMAYSDGTPLSVYNNYPTLRTAGYTPVVSRWRWYTDESSVTPTSTLAAENITPSDVVNGEVLKLRVSMKETKGANGENVKFGLQYSQYADFSDGGTFLTSTTSCTSTSTWCYADGAGTDNATITAAVLSDSESCVAAVGVGCGTHNESVNASSSTYHPSLTTKEFEFTIKQGIPRVGGVYYFRMWDMVNNEAVGATSTYPSLLTQGALLTFGIAGLPAGTTTEGVTTDVSTTPTSLGFGTLPFGSIVQGAHRLSASTNATEGYRVYLISDQELADAYGNTIEAITGSNSSPTSWAAGCLISAAGCFGYHAGDDVLAGGSTRFAPDDSYAAATTSLSEIMYSAVPTTESHDIVYAISVTEEKEAGGYENSISYIAVPVY